MKRAIITDSTFYFTAKELEDYEIFQVSTTIDIDGETFIEEGDLERKNQEIFELVEKTKSIPKTSQPSTSSWINKINELLNLGYENIDIFTVSSKLSGTYQGAVLASREFKSINVYDTNNVVQLAVIVIKELKRLEKEKNRILDASEINEIIKHVKCHGNFFHVIEDLRYLKYSGRISSKQLMMSNLLNVKLIITVNDGNLVVCSKQRSLKKVISYISDNFKKNYNENSLYYCIGASVCNMKESQLFYDQIQCMFKNKVEYQIMALGPSMSIHTGLNTFGVAWCKSFVN